jgi:hypothetical protein
MSALPSKRIAIHDFDSRLWLSGGRDQVPQNGARRLVGAAPELTRSIQSRWGSTFISNINSISLFQYNGIRYEYDGVNLYANGVIVTQNGSAIVWNGGLLTFNVMPPQEGLPDYLFIIGGGNAIKIAPSLVGGQPVVAAQQVTLWGIEAPPDGMSASLGLQEVQVIDACDTTAGSWTNHPNCTVSNSSTDPFSGSASMLVSLSGSGPTHITRAAPVSPSPLPSMLTYGDGTISLPSDIISFYFKCPKPVKIGWLWLTFNVGTGAIGDKNWPDYYRLVVQIVQTTNQKNAAGAQVIVTPSTDQWIQIAAPKSAFMRIGNNLNLDWSDVNFVRFNIGDLGDSSATSCEFDALTMFGGFPLGAGPAALLGGSQYRYYVTFGNNLTGSDSNPQGMQLLGNGTTSQPNPSVVGGVAVQEVTLSNIPTSPDPQVGNRKIWRTSAGGAVPFYAFTIPDNTTTTFTDFYGDLPGQPIIATPWTKSVSVDSTIPDYVDGGNGYYFKATTSGTTGLTLPNWDIPTGAFLGFWSPITQYLVGNWVSFNGTGYACIAPAQGPTQSPTNAAYWVVIGTTPENTVVWTWAGLNEVPHLSLDMQLLLDNAPPQITYGDAVGPYQGSMWWGRDSVPGRRGWIYSSPPGRPESVANQFAPTSDDDPTQKLVIFDYTLWLITTKIAFQTDGQNPEIVFYPIMYATGTTNPFSAVAGQEGIYYQASDGIRIINRAGSFLPGFEALDTIQRGQQSENVLPFVANVAAYCRNEIIFSNGQYSFGLQRGGDGYVWRILGVGLQALYYERNDNKILASFYGLTMLYEDPQVLVDQSANPLIVNGVMFELQTPSQLPDEGQVAVIRRIFIDIDCQVEPAAPAQVVGVIAICDNVETSLGNITNTARSTIELAFQQPARQFSLRLLGCLTNRIEVFGVELDVALTGAEITQGASA